MQMQERLAALSPQDPAAADLAHKAAEAGKAGLFDEADGTTSSSDGQYFRAGGRAGPVGAVNAKYGIDPGAVLYTHVSGRYGPFHTRVISATTSEAPYVLDGLHHFAHQTDLRIAEHYTDTAGATDHVFGLCHLLGYRFAPRVKDLKDRKLYTVDKIRASPFPMISSPTSHLSDGSISPLTGDYVWADGNSISGFRPLRAVPAAFLAQAA